MILYDTLYDLLATYIFGTVSAGTFQELVCILASTAGALYVVALPFLLVWRIIRTL